MARLTGLRTQYDPRVCDCWSFPSPPPKKGANTHIHGNIVMF